MIPNRDNSLHSEQTLCQFYSTAMLLLSPGPRSNINVCSRTLTSPKYCNGKNDGFYPLKAKDKDIFAEFYCQDSKLMILQRKKTSLDTTFQDKAQLKFKYNQGGCNSGVIKNGTGRYVQLNFARTHPGPDKIFCCLQSQLIKLTAAYEKRV